MAEPSNRERAKAKLNWDEATAAPVKVERTEELSVHSDKFDALVWSMLHDSIPPLRRTISDQVDAYDYVRPAYADLFSLFFQAEPTFRDRDTLKEGYADNHLLLNYVNARPEVAELRKSSVYHEYNTGFAMLDMAEIMRQAFEDLKNARAALNEALEQLQEALQAAEEEAAGGGGAQEGEEALGEALGGVQAAEQALDQAALEAAEEIGHAAEQAGEKIAEQEAQAAAFGHTPGQLQKMSYAEREALSKRLDQGRLKTFADLVGRWRMASDAMRRRSMRQLGGTRVDVRFGNDLARLAAMEMVNLAVPELEDLFWVRWADHGLMQYDEVDEVKAGRGPLIVVCDESYSMTASVSNTETREMWSKAFTLALIDQARRGKRDFHYVGFASAGEVWSISYVDGVMSIDDIVPLIEHFFAGGTEYTGPLTKAADIVREYASKRNRRQADIVFITDDDCRVSTKFVESWTALREELGTTVYGVQIGTTSRNAMHQLCDKTINLSEFNASPEGMADLFQGI